MVTGPAVAREGARDREGRITKTECIISQARQRRQDCSFSQLKDDCRRVLLLNFLEETKPANAGFVVFTILV